MKIAVWHALVAAAASSSAPSSIAPSSAMAARGGAVVGAPRGGDGAGGMRSPSALSPPVAEGAAICADEEYDYVYNEADDDANEGEDEVRTAARV